MESALRVGPLNTTSARKESEGKKEEEKWKEEEGKRE